MDDSYIGNESDYKRWAESVAGIGTAIVVPEWNGPEEVQRGVDMGNVAKIVVGVLAIGGTFFILLVREFGKFIDEVSPYNWGESEVLKDEYKR